MHQSVKDKYFFISDVHLGLQSKETEKKKERLLVEFLDYARAEAKELYILGDLFDYWFEYSRVYQKGFFRTLTALDNLVESGTKVHYLIGNHDFSHRDFFGTDLGITMYERPVSLELSGRKFYLAHGDGLVKNDTGYKILKCILRNKIIQRIYSMIHPDLGILLASSTSKKSRDYTSQKDYGQGDGLFDTAKMLIDKGYDYVVFGHSHRKAEEKYKNGTYINLGSWLTEPCFGVYENSCFKIVQWKGK